MPIQCCHYNGHLNWILSEARDYRCQGEPVNVLVGLVCDRQNQ